MHFRPTVSLEERPKLCSLSTVFMYDDCRAPNTTHIHQFHRLLGGLQSPVHLVLQREVGAVYQEQEAIDLIVLRHQV